MMATQTTSLASAMANAFGQFEAATKDATNPHFKSKYADLPAVIEAVKPALLANRLFFTQATHEMAGGVCVETQVHHESGESMSFGKLFVPANKQDAQGYGSALTYARRYSLMTAFGIPAEDDDGNAAAKAVANDTNGSGLKRQIEESVRQTPKRDLPFPQGPAKGITQLKEMGRALWRDVESCGDDDTLSALIASHGPLVRQLREALPGWWDGYEKDGNTYPGLGEVITNKQAEFGNANWRTNPLNGG